MNWLILTSGGRDTLKNGQIFGGTKQRHTVEMGSILDLCPHFQDLFLPKTTRTSDSSKHRERGGACSREETRQTVNAASEWDWLLMLPVRVEGRSAACIS